VIARRAHGQAERAGFYRRADGRRLEVCQNLQDMVLRPPRGLPVSVRGKLAYVYADGNRFGAIRAAVGTREFARQLVAYQEPLLRRITAWLRDGLAADDLARAAPIGTAGQARFETLLWGGDEFLFVVPAWLGMLFLGQAVSAMKGWRIGGHDLTFAFGMAICDVKAPVRQARDTVHRLAETVKDAMGATPRSGAAIQVYESHSLIDAPLKTQRRLLFGVPPEQTERLDRALIIAAEALPDLPEEIRTLTDEGAEQGALSGATLHAAINAARGEGLLSAAGEAAARKILDDAFNRFGREIPPVSIPGFGDRGLVLDLCLVAMLRDYCALPQGGSVPGFPAVTE
jgi:hypothetical protein